MMERDITYEWGVTLIKIILLTAFLYIVIFGCSESFAWTKADTARQVVYSTLHIMDWGQTRYIATHPEKYHETNPILGSHPSLRSVNLYFGATLLCHTAISAILPDKYRRAWQYVTIGVEGAYVVHNFNIGIKFGF